MTEMDMIRALAQAYNRAEGGNEIWRFGAVLDRARALLSAPALPAEPPEGCVRVRLPVHQSVAGNLTVHATSWTTSGGMRDWATDGIVIANVIVDVRLHNPPEIVVVAEPAP